MKNILLCGVGGQGTVLASRLIALAAMKKGLFARTAETIGMAQRGGCVVSHVRFGAEEALHAPLIPKQSADLILAFEPAEAVRALPYLKQGGAVIVNTKEIPPVTASLGLAPYSGSEMLAYLAQAVTSLHCVDGAAICKAVGSDKVLNIVLLATAAKSGALGLTEAEMREAVKERVPARFLTLNLAAFDAAGAAV